jgi:hypothetical protein
MNLPTGCFRPPAGSAANKAYGKQCDSDSRRPTDPRRNLSKRHQLYAAGRVENGDITGPAHDARKPATDNEPTAAEIAARLRPPVDCDAPTACLKTAASSGRASLTLRSALCHPTSINSVWLAALRLRRLPPHRSIFCKGERRFAVNFDRKYRK